MKKIIVLLMALFMVMSLAACGSSDDARGTSSETTTKATVKETETKESTTAAAAAEIQTTTQTTTAAVAETTTVDILRQKLEAVAELWSSISEDEDKRMFYELCREFSGAIYENGIEMNLEEQKEFLEYAVGLEKDEHDAFIKVFLAHNEAILGGYIIDYNEWYPDDFGALYNEYLATYKAADAVVDTAKKVFDRLELNDNVLFDEEGVMVTFDGCETDGWGTAKLKFTLINNNESNKIASIYMKAASANGVGLVSNIAGNGIASAVSGSTESFTYIVNLSNFELVWDKLGTNFVETPVETLGFDYEIKVGSKSDTQYRSAVLKTSMYDGGDMKALYGDFIASVPNITLSDGTVINTDIYAKLGEKGLVVVFDASALIPYTECGGVQPYIDLNIAGSGIGGIAITGNKYDCFYPSGCMILYLDTTADQLRKTYEIGNNEPLNIKLTFENNDYIIIK